MKRCIGGLLVLLAVSNSVWAAEIDFIETYVLAPDRQRALEQLLPGTEEYYYYHCLHHEQLEQYERVEQLLAEWIKRFNYTPRVREILNRQALLAFEANPEKTLDYLRDQLKLKFDHQRTSRAEQRSLPDRLDPQVISTERLDQRAFAQKKNLNEFEDRALRRLSGQNLNPDQRRALLSRLTNPDTPRLVDHILADLAHHRGTAFGSLPIHRLLLQAQLDDCLKRNRQLINDQNFVSTYLTRLHPRPGIDWRHDPQEYSAYLNRLWKFVEPLPVAQNSLKAHVLYHRLHLDRSQGEWNRELFDQYLALPRSTGYVNPRYLQSVRGQQPLVNLSANYQSQTLLPPVGNDEPLIRSYLAHFFEQDTTYERYTRLLRDTFVRTVFAETKLVLGLGDPQQWYNMLTPAQLQALRDRVDLEFAATNKQQFDIDQPVSLELFVKNVRTLIVKVYEINTRNYYSRNQREVDTDINLDGLVPNWETTHEYQEAPLRRVSRKFTFPELNRRGVFVVDLIGGGQSSRVLVRKGHLRLLPRLSAAGLALTVIDEANQPRPEATLWMDGKLWTPDDNHEIVLPFSTRPGQRSVVVNDGDFSALARISHPPEQYTLEAGFYVNREALLPQQEARLVVRPSLRLNGVPVTLDLLDDAQLTVTTTDQSGTESSRSFEDIDLAETAESGFKFHVPHRLSQVRFDLSGTVKQLSTGKEVSLHASDTVGLNTIDSTQEIEDAHLARAAKGFEVHVLGKSGEPLAHRAIRLELKHRDYRRTVPVVLQSDAAGRVGLGALDNIDRLTVTLPSSRKRQWDLPRDQRVHRRTIHATSNQPIEIPLAVIHSEDAQDHSLYELRAGQPFRLVTDHTSVENGSLKVSALPAGDYRLQLHASQETFQLRVEDAESSRHYLLGSNRQLESMVSQQLNVSSVSSTDEKVQIRLAHADENTRIHVFAMRFEPTIGVFERLHRLSVREPSQTVFPDRVSNYLTGRKIGDEYQYIIDRRYALKFPGNPLDRPSLLLNPWAVRETTTDVQTAAEGGNFAPASEAMDAKSAADDAQAAAERDDRDPSSLDFLIAPGRTLLNLQADENGLLTIDRELFEHSQSLHIVAVDTDCLVYRSLALPAVDSPYRDLRLIQILKPEAHYAQMKQVDVFQTGKTFQVTDAGTSRFEVYDSLRKVFELLELEVADDKFSEFEFVTRWPELTDDQRREMYHKYASHELHIFLFRKDRKFFDRVVRPYLANKKNKTVIDHWLLNGRLDTYLDPWSYGRLNAAEQILISWLIEGERERTRRSVEDRFQVIPPDRQQLAAWFDSGLQMGDLAGGGFGGGGGLGGGALAGGRSNAWAMDGAVNAPASPMMRSGVAPPAAASEPSAANRNGAERQRRARALERKLSESEALMESREKSDKLFLGAQLQLQKDRLAREKYRQLYRTLDKTQEWAENNYFQLPQDEADAELVQVNGFWRDLARHEGSGPFLSARFLEATSNRHEALLALALLDLPFEASEHEQNIEAPALTLKAASPLIVFHEQIRETQSEVEDSPVLISQHFFQANDRYETVAGIKQDKFVTEEFLTHTVYGCQVVLTNPSSAQQRLDVLTQIPAGALPVSSGLYARSQPVDLAPFHTESVEYYFYFPEPGEFLHYPVHVSRSEKYLASAEPFQFHVVSEPSSIDQESWEFVSQEGSNDDVLSFLKERNLEEVNLSRIAFRMRDKAFFSAATAAVQDRHQFDMTLWSYSVLHGDAGRLREFLRHQDAFLAQCGTLLESKLIRIDPVERGTYEHLDYRPLVNARVHQLGQKRQILNDRLHAQYHRLLKNLSYKRQLSDADRLELTSYLLLQDRIGESLAMFGQVNPDQLQTRLQYDYMAAYLDLYNDQPDVARAVVGQYLDYPVDRWQKRFAAIEAYLRDIDRGTTTLVDADDRDQVQAQQAASEATFDFVVQDQQLVINHRNLKELQVNYYLMDIELLFSRNPFVDTDAEQFSQIRANHTVQATLEPKAGRTSVPIPDELRSSNVLIELSADGKSRSLAYFANTLDVQIAQNFGRLQVTERATRRPIRKAYVKVYARTNDGQVTFYKDGYTDLLGRFDYSSLSTNELDRVQKFSILVMSDEDGSLVKEAQPPRR